MKDTGTIQTMALGSSVVQSLTSSAMEETMPMAEKLQNHISSWFCNTRVIFMYLRPGRRKQTNEESKVAPARKGVIKPNEPMDPC